MIVSSFRTKAKVSNRGDTPYAIAYIIYKYYPQHHLIKNMVRHSEWYFVEKLKYMNARNFNVAKGNETSYDGGECTVFDI